MNPTDTEPPSLSPSLIEDFRLAAAKLTGHERRAFQAHVATKYCRGNARLAESRLGWGRATVELGLHEMRHATICLGAQTLSGRKLWEDRLPDIAADLRGLAEAHGQQDPTFKSTILYTRLTARGAIEQLRQLGHPPSLLPRKSAMANILNRMGFRLRRVLKCKPQKKQGDQRHIREHSAHRSTDRRQQCTVGSAHQRGLQGDGEDR